ncbi:MAG: hypothetical protein WC599_09180 [Bacteroidales bacterium]
MKTTKILVTSILVLFISIFIFSCNNGRLSRSTAEKLIKEKISKTEVKELYLGETQSSDQVYTNLENMGLISIKRYYLGGISGMELTETGKQYLIENKNRYNKTFKISDLDFGEITGIVEQDGSNKAEVNYTLIRKNVTPFGKAFGLNEGAFNNSVIFIKYDDGWRIEE